jgi:hypothetical protein
MAIQLEWEVSNTGLTAEYWYLMSVHITRGKNGDDDVVTGSFYLYKSQVDFLMKNNVPGINATVRLVGDIQGSTTVGQLINVLEAEIIKTGEALYGGTII